MSIPVAVPVEDALADSLTAIEGSLARLWGLVNRLPVSELSAQLYASLGELRAISRHLEPLGKLAAGTNAYLEKEAGLKEMQWLVAMRAQSADIPQWEAYQLIQSENASQANTYFFGGIVVGVGLCLAGGLFMAWMDERKRRSD